MPMSSLPPIVGSPRYYDYPKFNSSTVSLPTVSSQSMASLPTVFPSSPSNKISSVTMDDYLQCKVEAADRREKGKLKLCPEGYCTVKLTEDVYPSYWANLKASKICTGQEKDYEGNVKNYYNQYGDF